MVVEHKPRWVDIDAQYAQYRVNIETLDDPVPPSISSRRPMTALDVSGGEYLKGVHSAVLGGILEFTCINMKMTTFLINRRDASFVRYAR